MQTTRGTSLSDSTNPEREAGETTGSSRPRRVGVLVAVALAALAADILSKTIVVATLEDREPVRLLGGLLTLRETRNSGAAFSIGTGYTIVFTLIACGVVVAILRTARNLRSVPWAVCLGLLLGGAIGNLLDRLLRAPAPLKGHVVDWIQLPHWPVFNLADSAIVCGGVLAVLLAARGLQVDGTRLAGKDEDAAEDARPTEKPEPAGKPETAETPETPETLGTADEADEADKAEAPEPAPEEKA
ncbi:signal peptidase II [Actinomadura darangshiensis]|uniref:Lipoprotein signal peptidase n=1 Tax=Actinomadura darangshiensis TaxID=705336 RepID=A0A4R5ABJ8_9ACTN|nr:signal peptidase II [Actinomadura darangshiensis]TDD69738.1 signal peptidase II [Actinomadura darangshiensis]